MMSSPFSRHGHLSNAISIMDGYILLLADTSCKYWRCAYFNLKPLVGTPLSCAWNMRAVQYTEKTGWPPFACARTLF
jgi:hypothetical protein